MYSVIRNLMSFSIYPSIHPSAHPSVHPSVHPSSLSPIYSLSLPLLSSFLSLISLCLSLCFLPPPLPWPPHLQDWFYSHALLSDVKMAMCKPHPTSFSLSHGGSISKASLLVVVVESSSTILFNPWGCVTCQLLIQSQEGLGPLCPPPHGPQEC